MEILLETSKNDQNKVLAYIKKKNDRHIVKSDKKKNGKKYFVHVILNRLTNTQSQETTLRKKYEKCKYVKNVQVIKGIPNATNNDISANTCRFIFDIDGTLSSDEFSLDRGLDEIFKKMKDKGFWIHFATGRSDGDLRDLINKYNVEQQGISENGGVVILSETTDKAFGNRTCGPDQTFRCLKMQFESKIVQDMEQGSRRSEVIIKTKLKQSKLEKCAKNNKTVILASRTSFHIAKKGINKGSAIKWLSEERNWGNDLLIAVGDSDLDIPMFNSKIVDYSFAVGNASKKAEEAAEVVLEEDYLTGIKQMLQDYFSC